MPRTRTAGLLLTSAMNILFIIAAILTLRVVVRFFGVLAASPAGSALIEATAFMAPELGLTPARTPYGGVFDLGTAAVVVILLCVEWVLALVRSRG